jgi:hypothetical protein
MSLVLALGRSIVLTLAVLFSATSSSCATGHRSTVPAGFVLVASHTVDPSATRASVEPHTNGRLRAIVVAASGNRVELRAVRVVFADEDVLEFAIDESMREGDSTRVLELPTRYRAVREVVFLYLVAPEARRARGTLHVYGLR